MKTHKKFGYVMAVTASVDEVGEQFFEVFDEADEKLSCDRNEIKITEDENKLILYDPSLDEDPKSFVEPEPPKDPL